MLQFLCRWWLWANYVAVSILQSFICQFRTWPQVEPPSIPQLLHLHDLSDVINQPPVSLPIILFPSLPLLCKHYLHLVTHSTPISQVSYPDLELMMHSWYTKLSSAVVWQEESLISDLYNRQVLRQQKYYLVDGQGTMQRGTREASWAVWAVGHNGKLLSRGAVD